MPSVLRVVCSTSNSGGTGFTHKSGLVITAEHLVSPCVAADLRLILSSGKTLGVKSITVDSRRDLALLWPSKPINVPTLHLSTASALSSGAQLATWGFPSGYSGVRPLLTVGYLAGEDRPGPQGTPTQWVVNAAFNQGNSGGPVVRLKDGAVIGVVSSKLAPLPPFIESALKALEDAEHALQFDVTTPDGKKETISEAQIVAQVLQHLRSQTQLVIGFAVKLGDLRDFLRESGVEP